MNNKKYQEATARKQGFSTLLEYQQYRLALRNGFNSFSEYLASKKVEYSSREHQKAELQILLSDYFVMNPFVKKEKFARELGFAPETISRYVNGKTLPNIFDQKRILKKIGFGERTLDQHLAEIEKEIKE